MGPQGPGDMQACTSAHPPHPSDPWCRMTTSTCTATGTSHSTFPTWNPSSSPCNPPLATDVTHPPNRLRSKPGVPPRPSLPRAGTNSHLLHLEHCYFHPGLSPRISQGSLQQPSLTTLPPSPPTSSQFPILFPPKSTVTIHSECKSNHVTLQPRGLILMGPRHLGHKAEVPARGLVLPVSSLISRPNPHTPYSIQTKCL